MAETKTQKIARLNDEFRQSNVGRGRMVMTSGIQGLGALKVQKAVEIIKKFDDFSEDNDPHKERDFGSFDLDNQKIFWKFSYYASEDMDWHSEDPSDPEKCYRVLTIMLASEY